MASTPDYAALAKERARRKTTVIEPKKKGQRKISFAPGGLHSSLGVPQGQKLSDAQVAEAASGRLGEKARKQAQFARNVLHRSG